MNIAPRWDIKGDELGFYVRKQAGLNFLCHY